MTPTSTKNDPKVTQNDATDLIAVIGEALLQKIVG